MTKKSCKIILLTLLFLTEGFFVIESKGQNQDAFYNSINTTSINQTNVDSLESIISQTSFIKSSNHVQRLNRKIILARISAVRKNYSNSISILMALSEELDSLPLDYLKAQCYYRLAYNHDELANFKVANQYYRLGLKFSLKNQISPIDSSLYIRILSDFAIFFAKQNNLDSAELLIIQVINYYENNDPINKQKYFAIGNLIAFNENNGNLKNARESYKGLISYYKNNKNQYALADAMNNLGVNFHSSGILDSAEYYFLLTDSIFNTFNLLNKKILSSQNLATLYADKKEFELAHNWQIINHKLLDSAHEINSFLEIGSITKKFEMQIENDRIQRRLLNDKQKLERQANIQFFGIFLAIIFLFIFIFYSGKIHLPKYVADGVVFFAFVLLFEFLLVVLDPNIDKLSEGRPLVKLGCNVLLAVCIIPLHAIFERKLKKYISASSN